MNPTPDDTVLLLQRDLLDAGRRIWRRKRRWAWARVIFMAGFLIAIILWMYALTTWVARVERKISGPPPVDRPSLP